MEVGLTRNFFFFFFCGKSSQNSPRPVLIFWSSIITMCILSVYTLLKVVAYYDLIVLSMSVMGFQKKKLGGWVGGVGSIQFFFGFWNFFNFAKPLTRQSEMTDPHSQ